MSLRALFLLPALALAQSDPGFPIYSAASIANSGANLAGQYAPNTLITIYGVNLSPGTQAVGLADIRNGVLPTTLGALSARVLIGGQFASLYFVSPTQINALIPPHVLPGTVTLQVVTNGRAGPAIPLRLEESAPALFEGADRFVIATHGNGPLVTASVPAMPGEIVVLYATGLGSVVPAAIPNRIAPAPAPLAAITTFQVFFEGVPVPLENILYAGVTPGFAGLFQINLRLPDPAPANPEIRVASHGRLSPPARYLHLR